MKLINVYYVLIISICEIVVLPSLSRRDSFDIYMFICFVLLYRFVSYYRI